MKISKIITPIQLICLLLVQAASAQYSDHLSNIDVGERSSTIILKDSDIYILNDHSSREVAKGNPFGPSSIVKISLNDEGKYVKKEYLLGETSQSMLGSFIGDSDDILITADKLRQFKIGDKPSSTLISDESLHRLLQKNENLGFAVALSVFDENAYLTFQHHKLTKSGSIVKLNLEKQSYELLKLPSGPNLYMHYIYEYDDNKIAVNITGNKYGIDKSKHTSSGLAIYQKEPFKLLNYVKTEGTPSFGLYDNKHKRHLLSDLERQGRLFVIDKVGDKLRVKNVNVGIKNIDTVKSMVVTGDYIYTLIDRARPIIDVINPETPLSQYLEGWDCYSSGTLIQVLNRKDFSVVKEIAPYKLGLGDRQTFGPADIKVTQDGQNLLVLFSEPGILSVIDLDSDGLVTIR